MNRQELYNQAMRGLSSRRQRAETLAVEKTEEVYAACPELAQWDRQMREAGCEAALLAAGGKAEESRQKLEALHQLKAQRGEALAKHGYTEEDLYPRWHCPHCQDTGRVEGALCACVEEELKRLRREEVNRSGPLTLCRFENFDLNRYPQQLEGFQVSPRALMEANLKNCVQYAQKFPKNVLSLYMYGDAGLGKTHLALSIAGAVLERGYDVVYVSAQSAFSKLDAERRSWEGKGDFFTTLLEADLLVLDDLGTEYLDAYTRSRLYELINGRMNRRATIYTTNICTQSMLEQRYTEKIASRLLGECHPMRFLGQDIRLQAERARG